MSNQQRQLRSKSLPRVRNGQLLPGMQIPPLLAPFPKQHSCYRPKPKAQQHLQQQQKEHHRERALDGRGDMGHRSLRPCCRHRHGHSQGPSPSPDHQHSKPAATMPANPTASKGGNKKAMPLEERPPFNLDTRIEGEDEVDELTGKYVRRNDRASNKFQKESNAFSGGTANPLCGTAGDPTVSWANSLRESFHRTSGRI